jgi:hypothetical protein
VRKDRVTHEKPLQPPKEAYLVMVINEMLSFEVLVSCSHDVLFFFWLAIPGGLKVAVKMKALFLFNLAGN